MGTVLSKMTNKLELYLKDVYKIECVIKAPKEEVEFIKTGIESLVQNIVDLVLDLISKNEKFEDFFKVIKRNCDMKTYKIQQFQEALMEVYFCLKTGKQYVKVKRVKTPIIKVGSFYEETKNNFPDEFDFIFLLFCVVQQVGNIYSDAAMPHWQIFASCTKTVTASNKETLKHISTDGTRELHFDKYVQEHGPASMLQFNYANGSGRKRHIYVDLVPAYKVIVDERKRYCFGNFTDTPLNPKSFLEEALSARTCLSVRAVSSFTINEVNFVKTVLSKKHVRVYRILKCLINGHGDSETLKELLKSTANEEKKSGYSSYIIKTMMIYHHDECANTDTEEIGPCVLQVLEAIHRYDNTEMFPKLYELGLTEMALIIPKPAEKFCILPYLLSLVQTLRSIQNSEGSYDYEKVRMRSLSRQYLDGLDRDDPKNVSWFRYIDTLGDNDPNYDSFLAFLNTKCSG